MSATFISPRTGWALGVRRCHEAGCPRLALRETTDRGRHWFAVPAPPAPWIYQHPCCRAGPDAVSNIRFADQSDGWAYGPGLWATHDRGRTWHRVPTRGWSVQSLAAGNGWAIAVLSRGSRFRVESSPATADRWRAVRGASGTGFSPAAALAAATGYLTASEPLNRAGQPSTTSVLLAGPADRSAAWQRLPIPCPRWTQNSFPAATPGSLVVLCAGQPGAGSQQKQVYITRNRGRTWRRLADLPGSGYLESVSISAAGTIILSGSRSDVYISWNHGRTWHGAASTSPVLNRVYLTGGALTAAMTTASQGFIIAPETPYMTPPGLHIGDMWLSYDNGRTWKLATIH